MKNNTKKLNYIIYLAIPLILITCGFAIAFHSMAIALVGALFALAWIIIIKTGPAFAHSNVNETNRKFARFSSLTDNTILILKNLKRYKEQYKSLV